MMRRKSLDVMTSLAGVLLLALAGACFADDGGVRDSSACSTAGVVGPIERGQEKLMHELADAGLRGYQLDYFDPSTYRTVAGLTAPIGRAEFCAQSRDSAVFQKRIQDPSNRLSFTNPARGFFKGGVCWWHSRFTRNAAYLAYVNPGAPKPTAAEARTIIDQIASGTGPIEIPGYSGLREFSADFQEEIVKRLVRWQAIEGTAGLGWVRGVAGAPRSSSKKLSKRMDELYDLVENRKQVVYQMLQIPGVDAHSWLVTGMRRTDEGYELLVHDSNSPHLLAVPYRRGDERIIGRQFSSVPYTSYEREVSALLAQVAAACTPEKQRGSSRRP